MYIWVYSIYYLYNYIIYFLLLLFFVIFCPLAVVTNKFPRLWDNKGILIVINATWRHDKLESKPPNYSNKSDRSAKDIEEWGYPKWMWGQKPLYCLLLLFCKHTDAHTQKHISGVTLVWQQSKKMCTWPAPPLLITLWLTLNTNKQMQMNESSSLAKLSVAVCSLIKSMSIHQNKKKNFNIVFSACHWMDSQERMSLTGFYVVMMQSHSHTAGVVLLLGHKVRAVGETVFNNRIPSNKKDLGSRYL